MTRLAQTIEQATVGILTYRFDLACRAIYEFTWDEYCDWYLELSKTVLTDDNASEAAKVGTRLTLLRVLETLTRLVHPFMPFITEEIWQKVAPILGKEGNTIMLQTYPDADELVTDEASLKEIEWVKEFILTVRRIRAERDIAPGKFLPVLYQNGTDEEHGWLQGYTMQIQTLGKIDSIKHTEHAPTDTAVGIAGNMTLFVDLADLIDPEAELERLEKELNKLKNNKERIQEKLENKNFIERAPKDVIDKERKRLDEAVTATATLEKQYNFIKNL